MSTASSRWFAPARRAVSVMTAGLLMVPIVGSLTASPAGASSPGPLTISMTSSTNPVAPGSELTYTIDSANTGGARVDGVTLTDQINGLTGLILTSSVGSC